MTVTENTATEYQENFMKQAEKFLTYAATV